MASINGDIRIRSPHKPRFTATLLGVAFLTLALSFGISLLPASASASGVEHGGENLYEMCHNSEEHHGVQPGSPACAEVDNDLPDALNQHLYTQMDVATSTTLVALDGDNDTLTFEIWMQPAHGTLSGVLPDIIYTPEPGFFGTDEFDFHASDGFPGEDINQIGTITITVVPVCDEGQTLDSETNTCVDETPETPPCGENQHLDEEENNTCVDDSSGSESGEDDQEGSSGTSEDPSSNQGGGGNPSSNGGGQGGVVSGPLSIGYVNTNPANGQVLGASTEAAPSCTPYLTSYLHIGRNNPQDQVIKLQTFLNEHGANLPVTGFFGPLTFAAVSEFQRAHAAEVLEPWVPYGLSGPTPTGYVYKTTMRMINMLACNSATNIPMPQLP